MDLSLTPVVQVDLSDDRVVMGVFGDGKWEKSMEQLTKDGMPVEMPIENYHSFNG